MILFPSCVDSRKGEREEGALGSFSSFHLLYVLELDEIFVSFLRFPFWILSVIPVSCEQFSPTPNERETTLSNHLFSIELARVPHDPQVFDVSFIYLMEVFVQRQSKECKFLTNRADKGTIQIFFKVLSSFKAFLPSLVMDCLARWPQHSNNISRHYEFIWDSTIGGPFKPLYAMKIKKRGARSKHWRKNFQRCTA